MVPSGRSRKGIEQYLPVYFLLLAIAAIEFVLAYTSVSTAGLVGMLLFLAICSAALGLLYFMHLAHEKRSLLLSLIPATIFVLLMLNMIWTDSIRLLHMRPFAH